jgi:hypothetical protein
MSYLWDSLFSDVNQRLPQRLHIAQYSFGSTFRVIYLHRYFFPGSHKRVMLLLSFVVTLASWSMGIRLHAF